MANKFAAALKPAPKTPHPEAPAAVPASQSTAGAPRRNSRQGSKHVGGYFDPVVVRQLKQITVDEDRTLQELLAESIDLLFQSRQLPPIASKPAGE